MWHNDLDLGLTMPNIELVRDFFIYNVFRFHVPRSIFFSYRVKLTHTNMNAHKHERTLTETLTSTL